MPRALISVYNKTGIVELASALVQMGWDIIASGGTERILREAGLEVIPVEQITNTPEMLGGRVKTLHPAIHAGILARDSKADLDDLARGGYAPIKMVVCNLYPFQEVVSEPGVTLQDAIENIDIGGVTLLRAAAKNFLHVATLCDDNDYAQVLASLKATGDIDLALKKSLAVKAFAHTRDYDTAIHAYFSQGTTTGMTAIGEEFPAQLSLGMQRNEMLRYGENPHQIAAYYSQQATAGPLGGTLIGGKALSYNNILDLDAAWRAVSSFSEPTVAIVKHLTPTGIACESSIAQAYPRALASDPVSAFGGVIAVNRPVDDDFVVSLGTLFVEAIAAPLFHESAAQTIQQRRKNCQLLQVPQPFNGAELEIRNVHQGMLIQRADIGDPEGVILKTVSDRAPNVHELTALQFAWKAVHHIKSNAIVLAIPGATVGIGGGVPSRVDAVNLAIAKAGERAAAAVMASDAFFPFADALEIAIRAGITAVIHPGGSIRDSEIIDAANRAGIAMVVTGTRHFRH